MNPLSEYLTPLPLIAVLRGLSPEEAPAVGDALVDSGFRILEVPLNSPRPFDSIRLLADRHGERCLIGAGTVLRADDVARVRAAGGRIVVMPHGDSAVIREAKAQGLLCVPGVATPTEAFAALDAGADGLKMFPAEGMPPAVLRAWRAVLPMDTLVFAVGGMKPDNLDAYWAAGADGFGTGSNLYKPGTAAGVVREVAAAFAMAVQGLRRP
jgi:2-dehydro-3-deoxyphosphogalactonate aldolase